MKRSAGLSSLTLALVLSSLLAADFWDRKPYTKWSQQECDKLISKSPWAHPYAITGVNIPGVMAPNGSVTAGRRFGDGNLAGVGGDSVVRLFLQIRFVTARPVKAAIGQMRLLASPENQALQDQVEQYMNQPDGPEIVIEVTYYSEPAGHLSLRQVDSFLRQATLPTLRNKVWLSDSSKDTHAPILRYQGPSEGYKGALLFFSRNDESGKPFFDGSEREMLFHMETSFGVVDLILKPREMRFQDVFTL
jgi:hypothetical protein